MNITTDSLTGLDWLDPTTTLGKSFNQMSALLGVGERRRSPLRDSFRESTCSWTTWASNGALRGSTGLVGVVAASLYADAISHSGETYHDYFLSGVWGTTGTSSNVYPEYQSVAGFNLVQRVGVRPNSVLFTETSFISSDDIGPVGWAAWLVRDTPTAGVPEPFSVVVWAVSASRQARSATSIGAVKRSAEELTRFDRRARASLRRLPRPRCTFQSGLTVSRSGRPRLGRSF